MRQQTGAKVNIMKGRAGYGSTISGRNDARRYLHALNAQIPPYIRSYAAIPAEAQHLRNICVLPDGVRTRTTSGLRPQKRQVDCSSLAAARAVTLVFDVSFLAM